MTDSVVPDRTGWLRAAENERRRTVGGWSGLEVTSKRKRHRLEVVEKVRS